MNKIRIYFSEALFILPIGYFLLSSIMFSGLFFMLMLGQNRNTIVSENVACHVSATHLGESNSIYLVTNCNYNGKTSEHYVGGKIVVDVLISHNYDLTCELYQDDTISNCKEK